MADEQMVERAREYLDVGGKEFRRLGIVQPHYLAADVVALMAAFAAAERARWLEEVLNNVPMDWWCKRGHRVTAIKGDECHCGGALTEVDDKWISTEVRRHFVVEEAQK